MDLCVQPHADRRGWQCQLHDRVRGRGGQRGRQRQHHDRRHFCGGGSDRAYIQYGVARVEQRGSAQDCGARCGVAGGMGQPDECGDDERHRDSDCDGR